MNKHTEALPAAAPSTNSPSLPTVSRLLPHLHFLMISTCDLHPLKSTCKVHGCFALNKADLEKQAEKSTKFSSLKIEIHRRSGRGSAGCGFISGGKLVGCAVVQLDLKGILENMGKCVIQNGWVLLGGSDVKLHLNVRAEPDPRFVFLFYGEPEYSPQEFWGADLEIELLQQQLRVWNINSGTISLVENLKVKLFEKLEQFLVDLDLEYKDLASVPIKVDESTNQGSAPDSASTTTHEASIHEFAEAVRAYKVIFLHSEPQLSNLGQDLVKKHFKAIHQQIMKQVRSVDLLDASMIYLVLNSITLGGRIVALMVPWVWL
ncbi:hypothetical protein C2S53_008911 [Perilla frutescens var. hirtella]|uniref:Uncharacterized protein n=1 Tax=Perilla frutescens var. hirtella TaxID=608512 RepID=A0AAD4IYG0_PERFH|nr:hypothetical protein C2S53_008911 [Perilla frutescens var. hirtella]